MKKILVCCSLLFLLACNQNTVEELPTAVGKLGSLVIVSDDETLKTLNITLQAVFLQPLPYLPAGEPIFEYLKPNPETFQKLFYNHKSILVLVTNDNQEKLSELLAPISSKTIEKLLNDTAPTFMFKANLFAKYQHVVYVFGKDNNDLSQKLLKGQVKLLESLVDFELKDQSEKLIATNNNKNIGYENKIKKMFGMSIKIPEMFVLRKESDSVFWFQYDAKEQLKGEPDVLKSVGLIIHSYPYKDTSDFLYSKIITKRDSVLKYLIPGELPGTYMGTTESKYYPPRFRNIIELNDNYTSKIRGWWSVMGLSQAGPFIRYVIHQPKLNRIFVFEGFVYKPNINTKERDLRLIESIALSIH